MTLDPPIDVSPFGAAVTLAINAAGKRAAMGVAGAGLYVFDLSQFPVLTYGMAQPAAAAFDNSGDVLFAVDAGEQRILRVDASGAVTEFAALANPDGPPIVPVGLAISADGLTLVLAERTTPSVRVYDMASQAPTATIPLDFTPSRFQRLAAAAFLLNGDAARRRSGFGFWIIGKIPGGFRAAPGGLQCQRQIAPPDGGIGSRLCGRSAGAQPFHGR